MKIKVKDRISYAYLLLLKDKSYLDITVSELCLKANVSRVSFYRNFSNFDDLLNYTVDSIYNKFIGELIKDLGVNEKLAWGNFFELVMNDSVNYGRDIGKLLPVNSSILMEKMLRKFQNENHFKPHNIKEKYYAPAIIGAFTSIVAVWINSGYEESIEDMKEYLLTLIPEK